MLVLRHIAVGILKAACFPILFWAAYRQQRRHYHRQGYVSNEPAPQVLTKRHRCRRRALTIGEPAESRLKGRLSRCNGGRPAELVNGQSQAARLTMLPFEVRALIWDMALGGSTLHIYIPNIGGHLRRIQCSHATHDGVAPCCESFGEENESSLSTPLPRKFHLLSLILTCRMMYERPEFRRWAA